MDDYRKGCLPCEGMILHGPKEGFLPTISHRVVRSSRKSHKKPCQDLSLFLSLSLAQQARQFFVERTKENLSQPPLAFWTLEEGISEDLLLNVLEALDPEQKLEEKWDYCEGHSKWMNLYTAAEKCPTQKN